MEKIVRTLLVILICVSLVSCKKNKETDTNAQYGGAEYVELLRNYQVRDKNYGNTQDDPEFNKFLDQVFIDGCEMDYFAMHYTVRDYRKYGIEKPPVDLGEIKYGFDQENFDYFKEQLDILHGFDYDKLSYKQQYDYDAYEYTIYESLADLCYFRYDFILSSGNNQVENLISNFSDFTFYDVESIDDYIVCLKDFDRYMEDIIKYTSDQAADGLPLCDEWIDYTKEVCDRALNKTEDNEFIVSFEKRIKALDFINDEQKKAYIETNHQIVIDEVLPAFAKVSKDVEQFRGKAKVDDYALYKLDKDYADLSYMLKSSSNTSVDEMFQDVQDQMSMFEAEFMTCYYDNDLKNKLNSAVVGLLPNYLLTGKDCLEFIRSKMNEDFPELEEVEYSIEYLDPDTAPAGVIAYYWPSPVDDSNQNIIRVNPNSKTSGYETYTTLAHEGIPGHLYQHIFFHQAGAKDFRSTISYTGYDEGWAVYSQYLSMKYGGVDDEYTGSALFYNFGNYFFEYSFIDIAYNYYGWNAVEIYNYFDKESIFTSSLEDIENTLSYVKENSLTFIPYGIGCTNILKLRERAKNALGEKYDNVSFNRAILENGPLPYSILETAVDKYISDNQ